MNDEWRHELKNLYRMMLYQKKLTLTMENMMYLEHGCYIIDQLVDVCFSCDKDSENFYFEKLPKIFLDEKRPNSVLIILVILNLVCKMNIDDYDAEVILFKTDTIFQSFDKKERFLGNFSSHSSTDSEESSILENISLFTDVMYSSEKKLGISQSLPNNNSKKLKTFASDFHLVGKTKDSFGDNVSSLKEMKAMEKKILPNHSQSSFSSQEDIYHNLSQLNISQRKSILQISEETADYLTYQIQEEEATGKKDMNNSTSMEDCSISPFVYPLPPPLSSVWMDGSNSSIHFNEITPIPQMHMSLENGRNISCNSDSDNSHEKEYYQSKTNVPQFINLDFLSYVDQDFKNMFFLDLFDQPLLEYYRLFHDKQIFDQTWMLPELFFDSYDQIYHQYAKKNMLQLELLLLQIIDFQIIPKQVFNSTLIYWNFFFHFDQQDNFSDFPFDSQQNKNHNFDSIYPINEQLLAIHNIESKFHLNRNQFFYQWHLTSAFVYDLISCYLIFDSSLHHPSHKRVFSMSQIMFVSIRLGFDILSKFYKILSLQTEILYTDRTLFDHVDKDLYQSLCNLLFNSQATFVHIEFLYFWKHLPFLYSYVQLL